MVVRRPQWGHSGIEWLPWRRIVGWRRRQVLMTSLIKFSIFSEPSTCSTMFVELALEKTHRNTIRESAVIMVSSVDLGLNYMALPLLYLTFLFPNSQELKTITNYPPQRTQCLAFCRCFIYKKAIDFLNLINFFI